MVAKMPDNTDTNSSPPATNIVVQMGTGSPGIAAMRTALQLARAFSFPIQGLFIEDPQLLTAASFSFTQEGNVLL